jgi:hypothetical protein
MTNSKVAAPTSFQIVKDSGCRGGHGVELPGLAAKRLKTGEPAETYYAIWGPLRLCL